MSKTFYLSALSNVQFVLDITYSKELN